MPEHGIDERHPSMLLTGIQSTAMLPGYPWGDLEITNPTHWLFQGTGVKKGDRIKNVMGYEVDSTKVGDPEWDKYRPKTQVRLGTIRKTADDSAQGSAGYYSQDLGGGRFSEVIALSAINFSWALDGWPHGTSEPESDIAKAMVNNALARWTSATPPKDPGSGLDEDPNKDPVGDPTNNPDQDNGGSTTTVVTPNGSGTTDNGGCAFSTRDPGGSKRSEALLGFVTLAALATGLYRRRSITRGGPSRSSSN
jgi:MYXO-CTERM domain-containing protein